MVKNVLTPQSDMITIPIPHSYIGKKVEILLYVDDEVYTEPLSDQHHSSVARFKGLLTNSEADKYHQHLQKARQE
jgi:hypothetical protein